MGRDAIYYFLGLKNLANNIYSQTEMVCEKLAWAGVGANGNLPLKKSKLRINRLFYTNHYILQFVKAQ